MDAGILFLLSPKFLSTMHPRWHQSKTTIETVSL